MQLIIAGEPPLLQWFADYEGCCEKIGDAIALPLDEPKLPALDL
jgi:hypothetical protein